MPPMKTVTTMATTFVRTEQRLKEDSRSAFLILDGARSLHCNKDVVSVHDFVKDISL